MKFLKPVRPLEEIRFEAVKTGAMAGLLQFSVVARVAGETVAEGLSCSARHDGIALRRAFSM